MRSLVTALLSSGTGSAFRSWTGVTHGNQAETAGKHDRHSIGNVDAINIVTHDREATLDATLPQPLDLVRAALLPDGRLVDVAITGDTVTRVAAVGTLHAAPERTLDLEGRLLLTAPAEPHAHLDKALSADVIRPPLGDLGARSPPGPRTPRP